MSRRSPWVPAGIVLLLLLASLPALTTASSPAPSAAGRSSATSSSVIPSSRAPAAPLPTAACLEIPRSVPCAPGPDQAVVDLLANASGSGTRVHLDVQLPSAATNPAGVIQSFWAGLWVSGAPCSIDAASYLSVNLYPPFSPSVTPTSPDWVVQVPVTDLAPSGSCDPLCQNASAQGTVGGLAACEDNIVLGGGWPSSPSVGRFAPGDSLTLSFWRNDSPGTPLNVWVNDTSNSAESAHWQYGASATVTHQPVAARFPVSNDSDGGWATPYDVAFGLTDCPIVAGAASCTTYDGSVLNATSLPVVSGASYWNASSAALEGYPWIATASSSGRCSAAPGLAACSNFLSYGGTGAYPALAVVPTSSGSGWRLGPARAALGTYGGPSAEFAPSGAATLAPPPIVTVTSATGTAGSLQANVTVYDPRGSSSVRLAALWCSGTGPLVSEVEVPASGTAANVSLTLALASENGPISYWVSERAAGSVWSAPVEGNLTMSGGTGSCSLPSPAAPWFGPSNATAVAGGYRLTWHENSTDVRGYAVEVQAPSPSSPSVLYPGNVTSTVLTGLAPSSAFNVTVTALGLSGASSNRTAHLVAKPLAALAPSASLPSGAIWHGTGTVGLNVSAVGGAPPFTIAVTLANGTTVNATSATNATTIALALPDALGFEDLRVTVTDANGVVGSALPVVADVWGGPLAPVAAVTAGDSVLGLSWATPASLSAPVLGYTVYLTANSTVAATEYRAGADNVTGTVEVWNTTNTSVGIAWPDNVTAYALVVPFDALSTGFATPVPLNATPAPILPGTILGGPGGPAPYTASLTTLATTGTNDVIDEAIYSFPGFVFAAANVTRVGPTAVYVNVTARVTTLGLDLVVLHVSDSFGGTAIVYGHVWVSSGAAPAVTAHASPSPTYVGAPVTFGATASGTGPFVYAWTFGDGANGSGPAPVHTYSAPGTFTATVTVVDNGTGGVGQFTIPVTVDTLPAVAISTFAGPDGSGSFAFHARLIGGSGNATFAWAFGDGDTGHGANVTHDYRTNGVFTVNVTVTDSSLRSSSTSVTVDVALPSGTTGGGGGLGGVTPLVVGLLVAALVGWAVAAVVFLRFRSPADDEYDEDDDD